MEYKMNRAKEVPQLHDWVILREGIDDLGYQWRKLNWNPHSVPNNQIKQNKLLDQTHHVDNYSSTQIAWLEREKKRRTNPGSRRDERQDDEQAQNAANAKLHRSERKRDYSISWFHEEEGGQSKFPNPKLLRQFSGVVLSYLVNDVIHQFGHKTTLWRAFSFFFFLVLNIRTNLYEYFLKI